MRPGKRAMKGLGINDSSGKNVVKGGFHKKGLEWRKEK